MMTDEQRASAQYRFDAATRKRELGLDADAGSFAIEAASAAAHAGLDHQAQLMHGIAAYIAAEDAKARHR